MSNMSNMFETPAEAVQTFLDDAVQAEYIRLHRSARVPSGNLYGIYSMWCRYTGRDPMSPKMLGMTLESMGYPAVLLSSGTRGRGGIKDLSLQPNALRPEHLRYPERHVARD